MEGGGVGGLPGFRAAADEGTARMAATEISAVASSDSTSFIFSRMPLRPMKEA